MPKLRINPDPDMPLPLQLAYKDSNSKYKDELVEFLNEKLTGDNKGLFHISATTLAKSPRQVQLLARHKYDITWDLLDWHFSLKGSIIHYILEEYSPPHWGKEQRVEMFRMIDGEKVMIHGQYDALDTDEDVLWDWKYVTGISVTKPHPEHKIQLNTLNLILNEKGIYPKHLKNCYVIERLDVKYVKDPEYPKKEYKVVEHPFMEREEIDSWIQERARLHLTNKDTPDKSLPFCTDEERWINEDDFIIYKRKKGTKKQPEGEWSSKAVAHCSSEKDAKEFLELQNYQEETKVVRKKGYPRACEYCKAIAFCNQRQAELLAL